MLKEAEKAPDFALPPLNDQTIHLSDFKGKKVVLYFYPKDDTPGCTQEACDFRDNMARLQSAGVEVLGISLDPLKAHEKFAQKFYTYDELMLYNEKNNQHLEKDEEGDEF